MTNRLEHEIVFLGLEPTLPDNVPREKHGVAGPSPRVIVKRLGVWSSTTLPPRLVELLDALGLPPGVRITATARTDDGTKRWALPSGPNGLEFVEPFDDIAIARAHATRRSGVDLTCHHRFTGVMGLPTGMAYCMDCDDIAPCPHPRRYRREGRRPIGSTMAEPSFCGLCGHGLHRSAG